MTIRSQRHGGFTFTYEIPSKGGSIPCHNLGSMTPKGVNLLCFLAAKRTFEPGSHAYPCTIIVLEGYGLFSLGGNIKHYAPGGRYRVGPHVKHAFTAVHRDTVFIKQVFSTFPLPEDLPPDLLES